jgi:hypothetical protein
MTALWVALILSLQLGMGLGLLRRLRVPLPTRQRLALGLLLGMPLSSLIVLCLDIVGIRLTLLSILLGFVAAVVALHVPRRRLAPAGPAASRMSPPSGGGGVRIYEWPFLAFFVGIAAISVWRAFYLPVTFRDAIVGLDLVAKYAAEQGTLQSSVFHDPWLREHLSNQPFYAPFPMLMQVVFRLAGLPFGQLWLSGLFLSFTVLAYDRLRESVHPLIAGVLMVLLLAIPEMYAHTFMVLNDYPAAVFFGLAMLFLWDYDRGRQRGVFLLSAFLLAFACWSRADTMIFVLLGAPVVAWRCGRAAGDGNGSRRVRSAVGHALAFTAIPAALVLLWHGLYLGLVLRQGPAASVLFEQFDLAALPGAFHRTAWLLGQTGLYGYLGLVFLAVTILDLVLERERAALVPLAWVAVLYLGCVAILVVSPAASLEGTLKRGVFKFFPLMAFALGESRLLRNVSHRILSWEGCGTTSADES